jgi:hypothetical protein
MPAATDRSGALGTSPRFRVATQVHARRFDDEIVILDLGQGQYFSLGAVGATVWESIRDGATLDDAVCTVVARYNVDEATARGDVGELVDDLLAAGLLERSD